MFPVRYEINFYISCRRNVTLTLTWSLRCRFARYKEEPHLWVYVKLVLESVYG
jgi:hypothetical protein